MCKLHLEETIDVYLAELQRLSVLFGGMFEKGLMGAFIAGITPSLVPEGQHGHFRSASMSMGDSKDGPHDCVTSSSCMTIADKGDTRRQSAINKMGPITWPETAFLGINPYRKQGPHLKYQPCAINAKKQGHIARQCPRNE